MNRQIWIAGLFVVTSIITTTSQATIDSQGTVSTHYGVFHVKVEGPPENQIITPIRSCSYDNECYYFPSNVRILLDADNTIIDILSNIKKE